MADSRFVPVNVDCVIEEKRNNDTKRKTESDLLVSFMLLNRLIDIHFEFY